MKLPSLVRLPGHRRFGYKPMHYDEDREDLMERIEEAEKKYGQREESSISMREKKIQFERKTLRRKFELSLQLYLIAFLVFDMVVLYVVENMRNSTWAILLALQVVAIVLKVKFDNRK